MSHVLRGQVTQNSFKKFVVLLTVWQVASPCWNDKRSSTLTSSNSGTKSLSLALPFDRNILTVFIYEEYGIIFPSDQRTHKIMTFWGYNDVLTMACGLSPHQKCVSCEVKKIMIGCQLVLGSPPNLPEFNFLSPQTTSFSCICCAPWKMNFYRSSSSFIGLLRPDSAPPSIMGDYVD